MGTLLKAEEMATAAGGQKAEAREHGGLERVPGHQLAHSRNQVRKVLFRYVEFVGPGFQPPCPNLSAALPSLATAPTPAHGAAAALPPDAPMRGAVSVPERVAQWEELLEEGGADGQDELAPAANPQGTVSQSKLQEAKESSARAVQLAPSRRRARGLCVVPPEPALICLELRAESHAPAAYQRRGAWAGCWLN